MIKKKNIKNKKSNLYNINKIEKKILIFWEKNNFFIKKYNIKKKNFCIIMPPPNITGSLHIGHSLQQTIIDIIIRYNRMNNKNVLLKSGTDHAGIATQIIILKKNFLIKNKSHLLIKKTWLWKKKIVNIINYQIKRLGISVNWSNEIFTMNNNFSKAVKKVFINLYKNKIIYKGKKIVNWDIKLNTVISDLEVKYKILKGFLWYLKYPLENNLKTINNKPYLIIATTRPETILGDSGLAINPKDKRYINLINKKIILPLTNNYIPIISDKYVNIKKGTGCIKITPGHDFNDYKIAIKNKLNILNIFNSNGKILNKIKIIKLSKKYNYKFLNFIPKKFRNLNKFRARKYIILNFKLLGFLKKVKNCKINTPYSDRTKEIIEPMLTNQWYLKSNILSIKAINSVKNKKIIFLQKKYQNMYFSWLNNIQEWCISRQLWWGHRIPIWYNKKKIYTGYNEKEIRNKNFIKNNIILKQDNNVLDTWFSSSLWSFVSLGWPKKKIFIFHPTNIIFSGFDIIFFWIARMILLTMYFIKDKLGNSQIPFKYIYITGLICDINGLKMSKSKKNTINPLDIINGITLKKLIKKRLKNNNNDNNNDIINYTKKQFSDDIIPYGADTLRLFLTNLSNTNRKIILNFKKINKCRNFCNKLWNAYKFILIYKKKYNFNNNKKKKYFFLLDRCIQIKLNIIIKKYNNILNNYRFDIIINILYDFVWNDFCNWYIEFSKIILKYENLYKKFSNYYTLIYIFIKILKLLHPIIPFITEYIFQKISKIIYNKNNNSILLKKFPKYNNIIYNKKDLFYLNWIKKIIVAIRNIRSEMLIKYKQKIKIYFLSNNKNIKYHINKNKNIIIKLTNLKNIKLINKKKIKNIYLIKLINNNELLIPIKFINKKFEIFRIKKEIKKNNIEKIKIKNKLNNKNFFNNAPNLIILKKILNLLNINKNIKKIIKQLIIIINFSKKKFY